MSSWQDYVNSKYKKGSGEKQSYADHVREKYGSGEEKQEKSVNTTPKYVGWGSKAQPGSVKRTTAAEEKREEQKENLQQGPDLFEPLRQYNQTRLNSLLAQERRTANQTVPSAALAALQEKAEEMKETAPAAQGSFGTALPSFKQRSQTGNSRFAQAEATGEYNPYEDALKAIRERAGAQKQNEERNAEESYRAELPRLTAQNELLGSNFSAEDYTGPVLDIERSLAENEEEAQEEKPSVLDLAEFVEAKAKAGWTQIGGQIMQDLDAKLKPAQAAGLDMGEWLLRKMRGDEYADMFTQTIEEKKKEPVLGAAYDWAVDPMKKATEYAEALSEEGGLLTKIGGSVIQNAVNMIPNAIISLMTGGANAALDAFNRAQTTFGGAVLKAAKEMATSPNFLLSYMQMYGGRYEDAIEGGASPYQAALVSTITTLMNAAVEMGGGVENLPFTKATLGDWVKNALDEGEEEAIQRVIDQLGQKAMVDSSIPWFSTENENAVINPKVLGENALLGTAAGGLISGPGMIMNNILNRNVQDQTEQFDGAPEISDVAMELIQEENRSGLETPNKAGAGEKYAKMTGEETEAARNAAGQTDRYGDTAKSDPLDARVIARMAQEAADAEIAEEQAAVQPAAQEIRPAQTGAQETAPASSYAGEASEEETGRAISSETAETPQPPAVQTASSQEEARRQTIEHAAETIADASQKRQFVKAAEKYGEAATVFASNYEGGDVQAYDRAFNALYTAGKVNLGLDQMSSATDYLTAGVSNEHKMAIWQAGRNAEAATVTPGVKRMTTVKLSGRQKRQMRMLDVIAKRYGYEIDIVDSINSGMANGAYTGRRKIVVAADAAEDAIVQTGVHELVHALKSGGENEFNVLKDVVLEHLAATGDFDLEYSVKERIDQYRSAGQNADREYAIEEIVAEAVPTFLTDEQAVRAFVQRDRTLAEKIRDFFVNFAREIREIAEKYMLGDVDTAYDSGRYEIAALLGKSDALTEIAETFDRALEAVGEKQEAQESEETRFARRKSKDADDVSRWTKDSRFMREHMSAAERGIFRGVLNNTPKEKLHKSADGQYIVEAGRALVYTDGNIESPKVFRILYFATDDGTELSWIFDIIYDAEKGGISFDEVRTVLESVLGEGIAAEYENGIRNDVQRENERGKGKARYSLSEGNRGEVSVEGEGKFSLNKPASQTDTDAFRNWFGESKIVNEDGSPKVMYHGSQASFTAFDKRKAKSSGLYGRGFYFTDSDSHAGQYGSLYQVYLKVENPLKPGGSTVTRAQAKKFLEAVAENEDDYSIENYGTYDVSEIIKMVYRKDAFGMIQDVSATAIGDLVAAVKLFNEVNGTKYDGIVAPTETVVFEPTQIKSATDNIGTFDPENPDIRFSLNNTAPIESVMADDQNLMLPADVNVKAESIRAQAAAALERGLNQRMDQQITGVTNKILRETKSKYAKNDMIANLKALIAEYEKNGATEDTLRAVAEMAKKIIESSSRADNTLREQYADIRRKLRETAISLTETQKQEAANEAGSYDAYRKSLFGSVKLANDGISLDAIWGELSSRYPELFPADTGEAEMVGKLTDFAMLMKPKYENPYGMDMDGAALEMAMRIQGDVMGIIGAKDAAQEMYGSAEKIRKTFEKDFKARLAEQKKNRVAKFQQIASDLKAAKAAGDKAEQAKVMSRYRAAMKATALDEAYAEVRATYKAREAQKAENRKRAELRGRVTRQAGELMKMFTRPEKGKRIPTALQGLVLDVLEALDLNGTRAEAGGRETLKAQAFREQLTGIRKFYEDVMSSQSKGKSPEGLDGLMMTISERNLSEMQEALETLGAGDKFLLREMTSDQLKSLESLLKNIRHTVESVGKLWRIQRYENVAALGDASIAEMDARGDMKKDPDGIAGRTRDFLALDMLEPVSYGERLGEGGKAIIQGLMDGEKEKFSKIRAASEATEQMMKDTGIGGYDIGKWRKNVRTVTLGSGRTVRMSDVNIMELYLMANRPQGLQHLLADGMKIRKSKATGVQARSVKLTQADIQAITGMMTEPQRKMADRMQAFLSGDVAKWGNDVTQRMYLYDAFTEDRYWPITSDENMLKTQEPEGDRAFTAITNAGFTKPVNQKASNAVIIGDAFETFSRHIGEMASYAGYAEVMTDTLSWLNYRQRTEDGLISGSVKQSIEALLGEDGIRYLTKLVQDINGARRGGDGTQLSSFTGNYKKAAVAGKIRVALQQPTSIVRAAAEIHPAYLAAGLAHAGRGATKEMQKWSSLAWWKSRGNYEIGIGQSTDQIFWGNTRRMDTVIDTAARIGALGLDPGKVDDWTWARMWSAVKREIKATRKDLTAGSDEYFKAVAERFDYIMDRTQVVDTVMHRSDLMRSTDGLTRNLTAFMGEPTKSYNMMMRAIMEAGRNPKDAKAYRKVATSAMVYIASAAATATMTALVDAFKYRDDDDEIFDYLMNGTWWEDYTKQWLNSFLTNVNPLNIIPIVRDVYEIAQGGDVPTVMALEGVQDAFNAIETLNNYFRKGNSGKYSVYGLIKPLAGAVSSLTGLPVNGLMANAEMLTHIYDPELLQTKSNMATLTAAYEKLYEATLAGDSRKALSIRTELAKGMYGGAAKSVKEIDAGLADRLAVSDERILKAWQMREQGNQTQQLLKLYKEIEQDGFTDEMVKRAVNRVQSLYQSEYDQLIEGKETEAAKALLEKCALYGMTLEREKAEKDLEEQLTVKTFDYDNLFDIVRSGDTDDIAAAYWIMQEESDAADPAKTIRSRISSEFREEYIGLVKAGRTAEAEKLGRKLDLFDIDADDREEWIKDDCREALKEAVTEGDMDEAEKLVELMKDEYGMTDESIASTISNEFKQQYIDLVISGEDREAEALAEKLQGLGLKYSDGNNRFKQTNLNKWVRDWEKAQEE